MEEIWVSVWEGDSVDGELIYGLTKENFTLTKNSEDVGFRFNDPELRDPYIPEHEYLISPLEHEVFDGNYSLTFSKNGYKTASEEFIVHSR